MRIRNNYFSQRDQGIAVLFTLGFLILLTVIAVGFAANSLIARKIAANNVTKVQTDFLMDSAIAKIISELQFIRNEPNSNASQVKVGEEDSGGGIMVPVYGSPTYFTSRYMGIINSGDATPEPYNPLDIYGGFFYGKNRTLSHFFNDTNDDIADEDFEVNPNFPDAADPDNYDITEYPVWYLFKTPEYVDVRGEHSISMRVDGGRRIIGRYAYADGSDQAPKWEIEYVYRKSDMPHTGRVGALPEEIFYSEAEDPNNISAQEFWPFDSGHEITVRFPRILEKEERGWGTFGRMVDLDDARYDSTQLRKLKKFIRLDPVPDPEVFWIDANGPDKKAELYKRFNLARTDWNELTVDDLLGQPDKAYVKDPDTGKWVLDKTNQTKALPFLRVIANDPATFKFGNISHSDAISNRRKQIAANLIDYNRKHYQGEPAKNHITCDITDGNGSIVDWMTLDLADMDVPTYTGIRKTPMIDSFGMLATVDFYENSEEGITDGKENLTRQRTLPLAGDDKILNLSYKQGFIGNLVSMYEPYPDKEFKMFLVLGGTSASGKLEITYKVTQDTPALSDERTKEVDFYCGDINESLTVGFNSDMCVPINGDSGPFNSGVEATSGFASIFSTAVALDANTFDHTKLKKKLSFDMEEKGFNLTGTYSKMEITAVRITEMEVKFKPRRAILQYDGSNADFANFEEITHSPVTLTGKFPVEKIAEDGTKTAVTDEDAVALKEKSGYILGGTVPDSEKFTQRTMIYGGMYCFDPRQNLNPDDWSFIRVDNNTLQYKYWQNYTFGKWYVNSADVLAYNAKPSNANNTNNFFTSLMRLCYVARKTTTDKTADPFDITNGKYKESSGTPGVPGYIFNNSFNTGRSMFRNPYRTADRRVGDESTPYMTDMDYYGAGVLPRYQKDYLPIPSAFHRSGVDENGNDSGMVSPMELAFIHRGARWETLNLSNASTLQPANEKYVTNKYPIRPSDMYYDGSIRESNNTVGTNFRGGDGGIFDHIKMTDDFETCGKLDINAYDAENVAIPTDPDGNPVVAGGIVDKRSPGNFVYSMFFKSIKKNRLTRHSHPNAGVAFDVFRLDNIATQQIFTDNNYDNLFLSNSEIKRLVDTLNSKNYPGNNLSSTNIVDLTRKDASWLKDGKFASRAQILYRPPDGNGIPAPNGFYSLYQCPSTASGATLSSSDSGFELYDKVKESFFVGKTINLMRTETVSDELKFLIVVQSINDTGMLPSLNTDNLVNSGSMLDVYNSSTKGLTMQKTFFTANKNKTVEREFNNLLLGTWANKESTFDSGNSNSNYTRIKQDGDDENAKGDFENYTAFEVAAEQKEIVTFELDADGKYYVKERKRIY